MGWINERNDGLTMDGLVVGEARRLLKNCSLSVVFSGRETNKVANEICFFCFRENENACME